MQLFSLVNIQFEVLLFFPHLTSLTSLCHELCFFITGDTEIRDTQSLRSSVQLSQFTHFESMF